MKYSQYKFKFYLNANHAIYLRGVLGQNHPHTWEITLDTIKVRDEFVQFDAVEKSVEAYLSVFQDQDINRCEPFTVINPTLENICAFFKTELARIFAKSGWLLTRIELAETPTRSYIIDRTDEIDTLIAEELAMVADDASLDASAEKKLDAILGAKN
ncbi:MAG: 6-carboxytetrahydropterin synthase [Oscillospiraceae bacterium]